MADCFAVNDSTYGFQRPATVRASSVRQGQFYGLYATTFPSKDLKATTATSSDTESGIWDFAVEVTLNGTVTRSVLHVNTPLKAGSLKIIKAQIAGDGRIITQTPDVGVSVTLDWKPGGNHEIDI